MGGCDQSVVHAPFFFSFFFPGFPSVLIKSGFISPVFTHVPLLRIMGAKSSPHFNEVMLELACKKERLRQTPLWCSHFISASAQELAFFELLSRGLFLLFAYFFLSFFYFFNSRHFLSLKKHTLSLVLVLFLLVHVSSTSFGWSSGSHWDANGSLWRGTLGTSINPGVYAPEKGKKSPRNHCS